VSFPLVIKPLTDAQAGFSPHPHPLPTETHADKAHRHSQTRTAEDYAICLAKEANGYENLDQVPEDCCIFFIMATYGEGDLSNSLVAYVMM